MKPVDNFELLCAALRAPYAGTQDRRRRGVTSPVASGPGNLRAECSINQIYVRLSEHEIPKRV